MKSFINELFFDEVRCGYLVTSQRKRLWNVQIKLINEFARICKKHNLKWFAYAGTLLGAARHNGFIPWDDDVDLAMLRPDYDKFIQIAPTELDSNYFLDNWIDYRLEEEAAFDDNTDENLQFLSTEVTNTIRSKNWFWPTRAGYVKLRDSNTIQLNWASRKTSTKAFGLTFFRSILSRRSPTRKSNVILTLQQNCFLP